jgi:hypothetical protein
VRQHAPTLKQEEEGKKGVTRTLRGFLPLSKKEMGRIDAHNSSFQNLLAPVHNGKQ